jgi:hypothetical protein
MMNPIFILAIAVLVLIGITTGDGVAQQQLLNSETYVDPDGLFSLQYPSDWETFSLSEQENPFDNIQSIEFTMRDKATDQSVISVEARVQDEPDEVETLEDVRIYHITRLSDGDVEVLNSSQAVLSGQEAFSIFFHRPADEVTPEYTQPANDVLMITTFDPDSHKSFTLRYGALPVLFSQNLPTFQAIVDSFKMTNDSS